jgi:phytoene dehydrogenase-like protein
MAERFDIVVAGAGHNSLIAVAYLAKAGYRCLVLEGRPMVGGVKSAQLTLRGFTLDICSSAHNGIHGNPILRDDELKLGEYGLEYIHPDPVYHMPFPDGSYLTQWRDLDRTCEEFGKFSKKDGLAYRRMITEYETVKLLLNADRLRRLSQTLNRWRIFQVRRVHGETDRTGNQRQPISGQLPRGHASPLCLAR